jgi:hypothetical protein
LRAKALPPPPPAIAGRNIRVKYVSPLAQAQEMAETAVIEQFAKFIGGLAAVNPQVLDIANFDEMVREYGKRTGIPAKILNSPKILAALRQARAKQEQTAAGAQNAAAAAQTAKVLSDTKVGGGSALEALTGAGAGGQPPAGGVA